MVFFVLQSPYSIENLIHEPEEGLGFGCNCPAIIFHMSSKCVSGKQSVDRSTSSIRNTRKIRRKEL